MKIINAYYYVVTRQNNVKHTKQKIVENTIIIKFLVKASFQHRSCFGYDRLKIIMAILRISNINAEYNWSFSLLLY